jgi:hypothetical protein
METNLISGVKPAPHVLPARPSSCPSPPQDEVQVFIAKSRQVFIDMERRG